MEVKLTSILPKHERYHLKPGIDPSNPSIDPKIAQAIFISQHKEEVGDAIDKKLLPKSLEDINFIRSKGWAKKISRDDFFHFHVCEKSPDPILDVKALFLPDKTILLYHTLESLPLTPAHINRNILSTLTSQPEVVHPKYKFGTLSKYSVCYTDLHKLYPDRFPFEVMHYLDIHFGKDPNGPYTLKNGDKLKMWAVLYKERLKEYLE